MACSKNSRASAGSIGLTFDAWCDTPGQGIESEVAFIRAVTLFSQGRSRQIEEILADAQVIIRVYLHEDSATQVYIDRNALGIITKTVQSAQTHLQRQNKRKVASLKRTQSGNGIGKTIHHQLLQMFSDVQQDYISNLNTQYIICKHNRRRRNQ